MRKLLFISLLLFINAVALVAQNVEIEPTISPEFFSADEEITITYDVTGTSLSTLDEAWIWLWLPDLDNYNVPSNINPASSNSSETDVAKFTKTENGGQVFFMLTLTLTEFTDQSKENINQVGMLIKGNDWSDGQSTDYVTQITEGFSLSVSDPDGNYGFYNTPQNLPINVSTSEPASIEILIDDVVVASGTSITNLSHNHTVIIDGQVHKIQIAASNGTDTVEKGYSYTSTPTTVDQAMPSLYRKGINYHDDDHTKATLVLEAPGKDYIFAIGDFTDWQLSSEHLMYRDGELFWITLEGLTPGQEYIFQYLIDGDILVADPYTDKVSDPWDDKHIDDARYPGLIDYPDGKTEYRASVLQTNQTPYAWEVTDFVKPARENLVIYELLVRDFDEQRTYKAVIDRLDYLQSLGVNAIEFMPTNEFEGNLSWGYNPNFYFAPDKYYGTKNDFKKLIDECHKRGIAVLVDLVLNHSFWSSPLVRMYWNEAQGRPAADNPWYNETHNFANTAAHWGFDFNHESAYTQAFVDSVNHYWISEYNVDGFRFDFTKGFTNRFKGSNDEWGSLYDGDRIRLLKRMADKIWEVDADSYVIFEHLSENSEELELANHGIMLWGNMNHTYRSLGSGNIQSISPIYHEYRGWDEPNLVGYMESHDEERVAWDILPDYDLTQGVQRLMLNAAFFFNVPGPKMMWQFQELGYDEELNNDRLGIKPTRWEYLEDTDRKRLFDVYSALITLKKSGYIDNEYFDWSPSSAEKWINITHPDVDITVVGNFGGGATLMNAQFTKNGTWHDYFSEETIEVTDFENHEIVLSEGDFKIFTSVPLDNGLSTNPDQYIAGAADLVHENIKIHPNPTHDYLIVEGLQGDFLIEISDMAGKTLFSEQNKANTIEVSELEPGMYVLMITVHGEKQLAKRFVKQ